MLASSPAGQNFCTEDYNDRTSAREHKSGEVVDVPDDSRAGPSNSHTWDSVSPVCRATTVC